MAAVSNAVPTGLRMNGEEMLKAACLAIRAFSVRATQVGKLWRPASQKQQKESAHQPKLLI
jgi:hypothetical protein